MAEQSKQSLQASSNFDSKGRIFPIGETRSQTKMAPRAEEMERAVLGALMLSKDALPRVMDILEPRMFYHPKNQIIFDHILRLYQNSEPLDYLTVKNELDKSGDISKVGGALYLTQLTEGVASAANIEYHSKVIAEKFILRELIRISDATVQKAYDETTDVFDLLDEAEQALFEVSESNLRQNYQGMSTLVAKTLERLEKLKDQEGGVTGVPSGYASLDKMTSGWQISDLVILAARPSMGKTAFALNLARNAAVKYGSGVAVFSLEMTNIQLVQRLVCMEAQIDAQRVRTGQLQEYEWKQLIDNVGSLSKSKIYIDDTAALSVWDLRAKCRRLKSEKDISVVVIDYLQLMSGPTNKSGNREQEIAAISRALKELAKELEVVVIALSQLSRAVESRGGDRRPILSDLRESGSIEQDADMVMFLYRPEYYGLQVDDDGNPTDGLAELIIAKQRNGPTGTVKLQFARDFGRFADWDISHRAEMQGMYNQAAGGSRTIPSKLNDMDDGNSDDSEVPF